MGAEPDGIVRLPAADAVRSAISAAMGPDPSPGAAAYRERLREEFRRAPGERRLDFTGDAALQLEQEKLLHRARSYGVLPWLEMVEIGVACQGLGFCNHHAMSRLMGVAGPTPAVFFGDESPFSCLTFVPRHTDLVADPRPGDLAYYPDAAGFPHCAIVRAVSPGAVVVESKFGMVPALFRHRIDHVPFDYGDRVELRRLRDDADLAPLRGLLAEAGRVAADPADPADPRHSAGPRDAA